MINILRALGLEKTEDYSTLADEVYYAFKLLKKLKGEVTKDDILRQINNLQNEVKRLKSEGISMWNAKQQIPKVFDIVDGAFEVMVEVVNKLEEKKE